MADNNNNSNQETARALYPLMDISSFPPLSLPRPQKRTKGNGYNFDNYGVDLLGRSNGTTAGAVHVGAIFDMLREVLEPTIDPETRNWFVGNVDTGIKAEGRTPTFRYYQSEEGDETKKRVLQVGYYETNDKGEKEFTGAQDLLDIDALVPYFAWIRLDSSGRVDDAGGELWLTYTLGGVTHKLIAADNLKLRFSDLTAADIAVLQAPVKAVVEEAWTALDRANAAAQTAEDAAALATGAVSEANAAAARALTAATNANAAADRVTDAILDIAAEKQAAIDAADAANTAATSADTAAGKADTAAANADAATANANTAAQTANDAATAADTAKANADTAAQSANDAAAAANTAKTGAETAAQTANDAADTATAAAKTANDAAATVNGAVESAEEATTAANDAAAKAEKAAQHPPVIDPDTSTWKLWNADNDEYQTSAYPSRGVQGPKGDDARSPRINPTTSTWETFDDATQQYVNTNTPVNTSYTLTADGITLALGYTPADSEHTHDDRYYTETEIDTKLNGYVDKTSAQEISGAKTFTTGSWILKSTESNEIKDVAFAGGTIDQGSTSNLAAIRRGIDFRWYSTHWVIGNIRNDSDGTHGFGIGLVNSNNRLDLGLRVTKDKVYSKGFATFDGTSSKFLMADGSTKEVSSLGEDYVKKDGDEMDGDLWLRSASASAPYRILRLGVTDGLQVVIDNPGWVTDTNGRNAAFRLLNAADNTNLGALVLATSGIYYRDATNVNNTIWHSGNGGDGSGLDADSVDGLHGVDLYGAIAYNYTSGILVTLDIATTVNSMVAVHILGNSYRNATAPPIDTVVQFYNYTAGNQIYRPTAIHNGYNFGDIKVFYYNNKLCLWFSQTNASQTFIVTAYDANNKGKPVKVSLSNQVMPEAGVSNLVTIAPSISALTTDNVASATKLQTARTLTIGNTGKTFDGSGNQSWSLDEIGAAPLGANAVTALNAVPIDKPLVIATINSATAQTFGLANTSVPVGREIHVIINNTSSAALTVAIPTAGAYKNCSEDAAITIDAGKYGEISAVSDGTNIYLRAIGS